MVLALVIICLYALISEDDYFKARETARLEKYADFLFTKIQSLETDLIDENLSDFVHEDKVEQLALLDELKREFERCFGMEVKNYKKKKVLWRTKPLMIIKN